MKHKLLFYALTLMVGMVLWMGCSGKTGTEEGMAEAEKAAAEEIVGQITSIDNHANVVTDIKPAAFTALGWKKKDAITVEFEDGQKIDCRYVENYGDVPVGDYLVRFSVEQSVLKIAINEGYLAETLKIKSPGKVVLRKMEARSDDQ
jgi:S-adenosylmethionine hydrolase